jgi:hypothetical protein
MRTLINTLRRAITRGRLAIAQNDLAWMEARAPLCLREQRAHVRALATRLDRLEAGTCNPTPPTAEEVLARAERRLKEVLL